MREIQTGHYQNRPSNDPRKTLIVLTIIAALVTGASIGLLAVLSSKPKKKIDPPEKKIDPPEKKIDPPEKKIDPPIIPIKTDLSPPA